MMSVYLREALANAAAPGSSVSLLVELNEVPLLEPLLNFYFYS